MLGTVVKTSPETKEMNPMQLLKAIYETFGTPYPRASLIAVMVLGAVLAACIWLFAAKQVEKDHVAARHAQPNVSGPASTSGPESPAVTGNGNDIRYEQSDDAKKKSPPKKD